MMIIKPKYVYYYQKYIYIYLICFPFIPYIFTNFIYNRFHGDKLWFVSGYCKM